MHNLHGKTGCATWVGLIFAWSNFIGYKLLFPANTIYTYIYTYSMGNHANPRHGVWSQKLMQAHWRPQIKYICLIVCNIDIVLQKASLLRTQIVAAHTHAVKNYTDIIYQWLLTQAFCLQWRHYEHEGVSNHRRLDCFLNRVFKRRSNTISKLRVSGLSGRRIPLTKGQ